jgi:hypothetical protein
MLAVNEQGVWSLGHSKEPVTGILLWLLWAAEAGTITGIAALVPYNSVTSTPFCEPCEAWTAAEEDVARLEVTELDLMRQALEQGKWEVLSLLPKASPESADRLRLDLWVCPQCRESCYLTVKRLTTTVNQEGKEETKTEEVVSNMAVPAQVVSQVRAIMLAAPAADAAAAAPAVPADGPRPADAEAEAAPE